MKKIINFFKSIRKRLATVVVTFYADYLFKKAKDKADRMYKENPRMLYVASKVFHPDTLTIYDRRRFKIEKSCFGYQAVRITTLITLRNGCYYHTPDKVGNQGMSEHDIEVRRRAFIRERLRRAKLI